MSGVAFQALDNGKFQEGTAAAGNAGVSTVTAPPQQTIIVTGISASYDIDVSAHKVITIDFGADVLSLDWDFTNGNFFFTFPGPISADRATNVVATLPSHAGAVPIVNVFYFLN